MTSLCGFKKLTTHAPNVLNNPNLVALKMFDGFIISHQSLVYDLKMIVD
jgi:hypothetical protein